MERAHEAAVRIRHSLSITISFTLSWIPEVSQLLLKHDVICGCMDWTDTVIVGRYNRTIRIQNRQVDRD